MNSSDMSSKITMESKFFMAQFTLKILDFVVNGFYMILKNLFLSKIFVTGIALEFLNLLMNTFEMTLQFGKTFEFFLTDFTDVELHFRIVSVDCNSI